MMDALFGLILFVGIIAIFTATVTWLVEGVWRRR